MSCYKNLSCNKKAEVLYALKKKVAESKEIHFDPNFSPSQFLISTTFIGALIFFSDSSLKRILKYETSSSLNF